MSLLGSSFGNMYQNLTNVIMTITPKAAAKVPAVLLNAHFDTAIGSPGQLLLVILQSLSVYSSAVFCSMVRLSVVRCAWEWLGDVYSCKPAQ